MADSIVPAGPISVPQRGGSQEVGRVIPSGPIAAPNRPAPTEPAGWGETLSDAAKAFGSGIARGATALADLPADAVNLGYDAAEYVTGKEVPDWMRRSSMMAIPGGMTRGITGQSATEALTEAAPQVMEYEPSTRTGRYARTTGEFIPGSVAAALSGGTSLLPTVLTTGVAPAITSEFAGEKARELYPSSQWAEPAARLAGSIFGGMAASKLDTGLRSIISPGGGADPARLRAAEELRSRGIPVTAGQATRSPSVLGAEADTAAGQAIAGASPTSPQAKAFTAATMRYLGSADDLATPEAMSAAKTQIVDRMTQALDGVDVPPSLPLSSKVADAAKFYAEMTPGAERFPLIRNIINRINQGQPITGDQLATWRSNLGELLFHPNKGVSGTAFMLRDAIDDAIENSMMAMGQPERIAAWREARDQYRNFLAVQDAIKVTKEAGINGIVTPKDLMAALAKQDKSGVVTGTRGEIGDFARSSMDLLQPLPASGSRGIIDAAVRKVGPLAAAGGAGFGALQASQFAGLGPILTGAATAAAVARPLYEAAKDAVMSNAMRPSFQRYLQNQLVNPSTGFSPAGSAARSAMSGIPSYGAQADGGRIERRAGGRVGVAHDKLADQLVGAAERAKKGISKDTETLLDMPDDHIAHALEVANRSI